MYNQNVQYPQAPGQPMPQGGNMPVTAGVMPPAGMAPPMGAQSAPGGAAPGQLDPAVIQQILALQGQQGRRNQVQRQSSLANMLRAQGTSQLMETKRPGAMNVLAAGLSGYMANRAEEKAAARENELDAERQKAGGKYFDLIRGLRGDAGGGMGFGGL